MIEENNINVEEVDFSVEVDGDQSSLSDSLQYPCFVIDGPKTIEECEYLRNRKCNEEFSKPLFVRFEGAVKRMGLFEVSLDYIFSLLYLGSSYKIFLYKSDNICKELDLNDNTNLINLITI